jgi:hypothetical protein
MAKVTISIEGTSEEIAEYLQKLAGGSIQRQVMGVNYLPQEIEVLYTNLQPEAQRIFREIATDPTGYDRDRLISRLGITGRGLAGRLSSVEFNRKRLFPSKPRPVELDWETWKYIMLPEIAEWISANSSLE